MGAPADLIVPCAGPGSGLKGGMPDADRGCGRPTRPGRPGLPRMASTRPHDDVSVDHGDRRARNHDPVTRAVAGPWPATRHHRPGRRRADTGVRDDPLRPGCARVAPGVVEPHVNTAGSKGADTTTRGDSAISSLVPAGVTAVHVP